ncbi:hypothetical protein GCM10008949_53730 [Deinococcus humi]|nr:hypothetical protein GCM10008949_53730 [Deinococcus humi]
MQFRFGDEGTLQRLGKLRVGWAAPEFRISGLLQHAVVMPFPSGVIKQLH